MLYIVRLLGLGIYFFFISLLGIFICLIRPFHPNNTWLFGRVFSWGGTVILGMKIKVKNKHRLWNVGPCVYVANHQDNLDLFVCGHVVPKRTATLAKKSLRWLPLFGQLYWLAGNTYIDRGNKSRSKITMSELTRVLKAVNISVWIFPEGTRNRGRNLLPFKKGAFKMAIEAGVPIIPVCISSYARHIDLHRLTSSQVEIRVLPSISTDHLTAKDTSRIMQQCWDDMKAAIDTMDRKIY